MWQLSSGDLHQQLPQILLPGTDVHHSVLQSMHRSSYYTQVQYVKMVEVIGRDFLYHESCASGECKSFVHVQNEHILSIQVSSDIFGCLDLTPVS